MYDQIIKLIKEDVKTNEYGDSVVVQTERTVFAMQKSIGQSEFYQAQTSGLKPEIKFVLPDVLDYQGETILKYAPFMQEEQKYSVLRTYQAGRTMELVCKRGVDE